MKTSIQIHNEGKYYVAVDLVTKVADQGLTEVEAVAHLKKGLEEHYQILSSWSSHQNRTTLIPEIAAEHLAPKRPIRSLS